MAQMRLVIILTKDVDDRDEGEHIYNLVKDRLADRPDVTIQGHVTNHFIEEPE